MQFESKIVDEIVEAMVQPATVAEDSRLAIAMFDAAGKHVFSIQRETDAETVRLVGELRAWVRQGIEQALERTKGLAKAVGQ